MANGVTTATFHIQTPYPGTRLHRALAPAGRIACEDWDRYDTRHVVYRPARLSAAALEAGYAKAEGVLSKVSGGSARGGVDEPSPGGHLAPDPDP